MTAADATRLGARRGRPNPRRHRGGLDRHRHPDRPRRLAARATELEAGSDRPGRAARPRASRSSTRAYRLAGHWRGRDEYRHVSVSGHFTDAPATLVQAVTELGGGYWVLTPFRTADGFTILVNRGFVPPDRRDVPASDETAVTGLLRLTEPKGGFLRANDPGQDRWYSRDVAAIAAARGLNDVAPYFIDEDAGADPASFPRGGLTVIDFPNNHLVYALTWFVLALMLAVMTIGARFNKRLPSHKTDLS